MAYWKQSYFTPEQLADGTSSDLADPLGDGWVNLLKYAFALQPFELLATGLPQTALEDGHLTLSYRRPISNDDLNYAVEVAAGVGGPWQTGLEHVEEISATYNGDWTETVRVRDRANVAAEAPRFIRLRVTRIVRDTDEDGLDDDAELRFFGRLWESATDDFDGDGLANLAEIQEQSDPTDYYNGQRPVLRIVSGDGQLGAAGQYLPQPLTVSVTNASGIALVNAPVTFSILQGGGSLSAWTSRTGVNGTVSSQYELPLVASGGSVIRAVAGKNEPSASVQFTAAIEDPPAPPGDVQVVRNPDGSIDMTWVNQGTNTDGFKIELWNSATKQYEVIGTVPTDRTSVHIRPDRTLEPP